MHRASPAAKIMLGLLLCTSPRGVPSGTEEETCSLQAKFPFLSASAPGLSVTQPCQMLPHSHQS